MHIRFLILSLLLVCLVSAGARAFAQASVAENEAAAIYVDSVYGNDANAEALVNGALQQTTRLSMPLKTIQAAVNLALQNNRRSLGTTVIVNPGTYREAVNIAGSSIQTAAPITIQAAQAGTAVISGSDVLTGWYQDSWTPPIYSHSWTNPAASCGTPSGWPGGYAPIARRTEMVFVNSVPLTQVTSYSQLGPGSFFIDDGNNQLYVEPAPYVNMSTATVEVATRPTILNIAGQNNVVLRGMVLTHAASCMNRSGSTINSSSNVLVDQVEAIFNNWGGLGIYSSKNVTVQNTIASYNGGVGLQANQVTNAYYGNNETDFNNWRGAQSALYDWGMGGTKLLGMRSTTVQNDYAYSNQAQGLWFDTDNENITINGATLTGNTLAGLQIERNPGPVMLENSTLCSNGIGVNVLTSEKLTIWHNAFYSNGGTNARQAEIYLAGTPGGQFISDWQTGHSLQLFTTGTGIWNNSFADAAPGQYLFGTYLSGSDWSRFADSVQSGGNSWFDPYSYNAFLIKGNQSLNLSSWQGAIGSDYSSWWGGPAQSPQCGGPSPWFPDFALNLNNHTYTMSGGKATATVQVNSFNYGGVSLSVSGVPSGVSTSLSQQNLTSGTATMSFYAANWAKNQTVPITLTGAGPDRMHTVTFYLHVIP